MTEERLEKLLRETEFKNNTHKEFLRGVIEREAAFMDDKGRKLEEILSDKELVREMASIETAEEAKGWFAARGAALTDDELEAIGEAFNAAVASTQKLDLDDLEDVAGGAEFIKEAGPVTTSFIKSIVYSTGNLFDKADESDENLAIKWTKPKGSRIC